MKNIKKSGYFFVFVLLGLLASCEENTSNDSNVAESSPVCRESAQIWEPEELIASIEGGELVFILEVSKAEDFARGHIPGARRIWRPDYEDKINYPFTGMRADTQQVAQLLRNLGYNSQYPLVLYDRRGDVDAARFLWILNMYGHAHVVLLNGGIDAWKNRNFPVSTDTSSQLSAGLFRFPAKSEKENSFMNKEDILQAMQDSNVLILDTRTTEEFAGAEQKKGAFRPGRIPGSIHLDWMELVHHQGDYTFKSCQEIAPLLQARGISPDKKIITYCHSGVRSAHTAFVLSEIMGYPDVANYDGSWTEWSYHEELPLISDNKTIINK